MSDYGSEWAVIGGLMLDNSQMVDIDICRDDFANAEYGEIFDAIQVLINTGQTADIITVSNYLDELTGKKWLPTVGGIAKEARELPNNIKGYASILSIESKKRQAKTYAANLLNEIDQDIGQIDHAIRGLMTLDTTKRNNTYNIEQALKAAIDDIDRVHNSEGLAGIKTGIDHLDKLTGGWQNSDLIVIGARPAMGKTAVMLNHAVHADVPLAIFSTEQPYNQIAQRLIAIDGRVKADRMRAGSMQEDDMQRAFMSASRLSKKQIHIYDKASPTISEIMREARKLKFKYDIKIMFVDYIQRLRGDNGNKAKHEQIDDICQGLKTLAKELNIPVIALAQVNRQVEQRSDKRPMMSDLKDSGAIEQEADIIMTLYRDEVYNENSNDVGIIETNVVKNRHGQIRTIRSTWRGEYMRVENYVPESSYSA